MSLVPYSIKDLFLHDLRDSMLGHLPKRDASRFANLSNRAPLELAGVLADYAHLGQMTDNAQAIKLRRSLCQLSGVTDDKFIVDFQAELVKVSHDTLGSVHAIFLKPIVATGNLELQAPVIIWDSGSEIAVVRPSLTQSGESLITTIPKTEVPETAQQKIVDFVNLTDETDFSVASGVQMVSEKEFANNLIQAVREKVKTGK